MACSYKKIGALSVMLLLSACGKGAPTQEEITKLLKKAAFDNIVQQNQSTNSFMGTHPLSDVEKVDLMNKINKNLNIQGLQCHEVKDMKNVYDCSMIIVSDQGAKTFSGRIIRKDDGTLVPEN